MVRVPMTWTTMELLPLVCLCVLTWSGSTSADGNGPDVVKVVVKEGEDAILPCSLSTKEDIELKMFDWKKHGQKTEEVFIYDAGRTYGNGHTGQDDQFKQRVSYFPDQLKVGNASIVIKQTKVTDRGNYTCDFPRLPPPRLFHIELVVGPILKDRTEENIQGASPEPTVTALKDTKDNAVLKCRVRGAFPKPQLQWQDSTGNIIPAEEQVTESEGRYDVILQTTVTKTDTYSCVATQKEINHQIYSEPYEYVLGSGSPNGVVVGLVVGLVVLLVVVVVLVVLGAKLYIRLHTERRRRQNNQDVSEPVKP